MAFLAALRENPYDGELREVYADWLEEHGFDDEALEQREWTGERQKSVDFLRGIARKCKMSYENLLKEVHHFLDHDYWRHTGLLTYGAIVYDFWNHFEKVTGRDYDRRYEAGREEGADYRNEGGRCAC